MLPFEPRLVYRQAGFLFSKNKEKVTVNTVECVECGANLNLPNNVMQGEILPCNDCGAELEVISLNPLTVDLAPMEMEDWGE